MNDLDSLVVDQLRQFALELETHPERLLHWEISLDPLSAGMDRSRTVTIRIAQPHA